MQTRRSFIQYAIAVLGGLAVGGSTLVLTACGNVAVDILTAFKSILTVLAGAGIIPGGALASDAAAALTAVIDGLEAYNSAPAADKTSLGLKLATLIQVALVEMQTFYAALNLTGTIATVVASIVTIILSTLSGFLPALPVPATAARFQGRGLVYAPQKRSSKEFRNAVNNAYTAHGFPKVNF